MSQSGQILSEIVDILKFNSKKATKFCKISTVDLSYVVPVKSTVEISQNFVAFLWTLPIEHLRFHQKFLYFLIIRPVIVCIFQEDYKVFRNLHHRFDWHYIGQIYGGDFAKFCGLLKIHELYDSWKFKMPVPDFKLYWITTKTTCGKTSNSTLLVPLDFQIFQRPWS